METVIKIAQFLRVVDENKQLSITNIALIIVLAKLAVAPVVSITELGVLLISLGNYSHKRHVNKESK